MSLFSFALYALSHSYESQPGHNEDSIDQKGHFSFYQIAFIFLIIISMSVGLFRR